MQLKQSLLYFRCSWIPKVEPIKVPSNKICKRYYWNIHLTNKIAAFVRSIKVSVFIRKKKCRSFIIIRFRQFCCMYSKWTCLSELIIIGHNNIIWLITKVAYPVSVHLWKSRFRYQMLFYTHSSLNREMPASVCDLYVVCLSSLCPIILSLLIWMQCPHGYYSIDSVCAAMQE